MNIAMELMELNNKLDDWLESKGVDLSDTDIADSVLTGCMIYAEPWNAYQNVRDYIENKL